MRVALLIAVLLLAGCERAPTAGEIARSTPRSPIPSGPEYTAVGAVIEVAANRVVLDHEAVPGGRAAGRTAFRAYADVLAEAPLAPGARVTFSYQMAGEEPILTRMAPR